ncbi:hypothetical protein [Phorcysia thermohydrogeniphila]|uniref:Uncharacterized protein n=1 Tax=Phorcysia thermohydrogeniphila TaxID=936138 RepID=A0A4R1GEG9_9BACT|nr:hypothetical protein [Phorcysia thermohydrogeniphila]TCK06358.1 hypothetical protein CLV27_0159 [Phorcysia thermohydrogeniphila]
MSTATAYAISFFILSPQRGINRQTVAVPDGFKITDVIADVPADSTLDLLDAGNSVFGPRPLGGGIFSTASKKLTLPAPKEVKNTSLELVVECNSEPSKPIGVAVLGYTGE